jgi:segregation and condensation protein B
MIDNEGNDLDYPDGRDSDADQAGDRQPAEAESMYPQDDSSENAASPEPRDDRSAAGDNREPRDKGGENPPPPEPRGNGHETGEDQGAGDQDSETAAVPDELVDQTAAPETPGQLAGEDQAAGEEDSDPLLRDIEAVLFIAPEPVSLETLAEVTGVDGDELALAVEAVRDRHRGINAGIVFTEVAGGYTFRAADASREAVERFCNRPIDYSLSPAAMETLAIVAHLQPITRPEIARIRGIGADTVVNTLLDKGLLMEAGRARQGGAIQYRTTAAFEKLFGLGSLSDLPPLEGFEATAEDVDELRQKLYLAAEGRQ